MPSNAPAVKKAATKALGAKIVEVGPASSERRIKAEELVDEFGYAMIPPYDAREIIAGQATCGLEIVEQLPNVDLVISPVSGGGLLSGVATAVKLAAQEGLAPAAVKVWGAEPELSADARESFYSGKLVEWPAEKTVRTIADGLRTQSMGVRNFEHVLRFVDGIVSVSEEEIFAAMRVILTATKLIAEPSGAVTLAAALFHADELPEARKVAVILSGGNLEPDLKQKLGAEIAAGA
jgi:threonine dehydratase